MVINTNLAAQAAGGTLNTTQARLTKSLARISSGSRIVQPGDDAAGLAVGNKLDAQVHRIQGAKANVANAMSFIQTQDGYLSKIGKAVDRMSELSMLAMDATKSDVDRALYNKEFAELQDFVKTAAGKDFNGVPLFSPADPGLDVTIDSEGNTLTMKGIDLSTSRYAATNLGPVTPEDDAGRASDHRRRDPDRDAPGPGVLRERHLGRGLRPFAGRIPRTEGKSRRGNRAHQPCE
jgi:flagellin-like hook-associated protein FlgL